MTTDYKVTELFCIIDEFANILMQKISFDSLYTAHV